MRAFPPGVDAFFSGLRSDNSREWFTSHRDDYDRVVRGPLESLAAEAEQRYGPARVMRPNRDIRFSNDKSLYKLNGALTAGEVGGVYLEVDAAGISAGGGVYGPSRDQLGRARRAIDSRPRAASGLRTIVDGLEAEGWDLAGPSLVIAPRGFPKDHLDIELLRLKHYAAVRRLPLDADVHDVLATWQAVEPLMDWCRMFVGPAESWP